MAGMHEADGLLSGPHPSMERTSGQTAAPCSALALDEGVAQYLQCLCQAVLANLHGIQAEALSWCTHVHSGSPVPRKRNGHQLPCMLPFPGPCKLLPR